MDNKDIPETAHLILDGDLTVALAEGGAWMRLEGYTEVPNQAGGAAVPFTVQLSKRAAGSLLAAVQEMLSSGQVTLAVSEKKDH